MAKGFTSPTQSTPDARAERFLTGQQRRSVQSLPADHEFVGVLDRTPIVRRPDGRLSRVRNSPRPAARGLKAHESYLLVRG
jgi:hypothetical protein